MVVHRKFAFNTRFAAGILGDVTARDLARVCLQLEYQFPGLLSGNHVIFEPLFCKLGRAWKDKRY